MKAFRRDLRMGRWRWTTSPVAALVTAIAIACGGGPLTSPSSGALVTFAVGSETFRVALTTTDQVAAARAAQSGGRARIPIGRVVSGTQVNAGWSWHLEDVTFAEVAIELCDDVLRMSSALESSSVGDISAPGARLWHGSINLGIASPSSHGIRRESSLRR